MFLWISLFLFISPTWTLVFTCEFRRCKNRWASKLHSTLTHSKLHFTDHIVFWIPIPTKASSPGDKTLAIQNPFAKQDRKKYADQSAAAFLLSISTSNVEFSIAQLNRDPDLCPVLAEVAIDGDAPQRKVQDVSLQNILSDTVRAHPQKINLFGAVSALHESLIHMYLYTSFRWVSLNCDESKRFCAWWENPNKNSSKIATPYREGHDAHAIQEKVATRWSQLRQSTWVNYMGAPFRRHCHHIKGLRISHKVEEPWIVTSSFQMLRAKSFTPKRTSPNGVRILSRQLVVGLAGRDSVPTKALGLMPNSMASLLHSFCHHDILEPYKPWWTLGNMDLEQLQFGFLFFDLVT